MIERDLNFALINTLLDVMLRHLTHKITCIYVERWVFYPNNALIVR